MAVIGVDIQQSGNVVVSSFGSRELTSPQMQELVDELAMHMRYDNAQNFILDMQSVVFMASACIGTLVNFLREVEHVRGRIALCNCGKDVTFLFKVTRLDAIFRIYDNLDEAKAEIRS